MRRRPQPSVAVHGLFVAFGIVIAAFFPFLTIYLNDRGLNADRIGIVLAAMALGRTLANPFWGHFADTRLGRVRTLRMGAIGAAFAALGMNLVDGPAPIAAVAFVGAACMVATGPNIDAIALTHLGKERMSDYGLIRGWESVSYAGASLVFGAILEVVGLRSAMPLYSAACFGLFAWSVVIPRDRPTELRDHGKLGAVGAVFREAPRFWGVLAGMLALWTGFSAAWSFFSLKIERGGGGPWLVAIGAALGGVTEVPVMRLSSRLQRRLGLRSVYVIGCGFYAVGFFLWGQVDSPTLVSLLTVFDGIAFGLLFTTSVVITGRLLPPSLYSTGNSVAGMVWIGMSPILGGLIGGFVFNSLGSTVLFTGAAGCALLGGAISWIALDTPALASPEPSVPVVPGIEPEPGIVP